MLVESGWATVCPSLHASLLLILVTHSYLCFSLLLLSVDFLGLHNLIEKGIKILTVLLLNTEKRYLVAEKDKTLGGNSFVEFSFRLNILMNR